VLCGANFVLVSLITHNARNIGLCFKLWLPAHLFISLCLSSEMTFKEGLSSVMKDVVQFILPTSQPLYLHLIVPRKMSPASLLKKLHCCAQGRRSPNLTGDVIRWEDRRMELIGFKSAGEDFTVAGAFPILQVIAEPA